MMTVIAKITTLFLIKLLKTHNIMADFYTNLLYDTLSSQLRHLPAQWFESLQMCS